MRFFCDTARTLGAKLGPLLFQLPPNFPKDLARLADLLALLPPDLCLRVRVPPRLLAGRRRLRAAAGAQRGPLHRRQRTGPTPLVATADFGYLRLRDEGYDDAGLASWVETIRTRGAGWRHAYVFFKHEASGAGPAFAKRFEALLAA